MSAPTDKATAPKEKAATKDGQATTLNQNFTNKNSNTGEAQRARVWGWLQQFGSATTIELRDKCDVMMPAARVHELRHGFGLNIVTVWTHQQTACGKTHRVARYVLGSSQPSLFDVEV